jgi:hypothetical protein
MNKEVYTKIAQRCSEYKPVANIFKNAVDAGGPTCLNCKYLKRGICALDLIDPIKENLEK